MFNSVEFVRSICVQRGIPISKLEESCGFSNGYLNPKKLKKIPYDRAVLIGQFLDISVDYLMTGKEKSPSADDAAPGDQVTLEESNRLLVALGYIREGEELSDDDLAFLTHIIGLLDAWFSGKRE